MTKLRVPFDRAAGLALEIKTSLSPGCKRIEVAGSLRRRKPHVGDLELVAIPSPHGDLFHQAAPDQDLDALLSRLISDGVLHEPHLCGPKYRKYESARLAGLFLDLFLCDVETWGVLFAIRTGPAAYSKRLVTPRSKGGLLRDDLKVRNGRVWEPLDGIARLGSLAEGEWRALPTREERDFLELCGDWRPPERRGGA